MLLGVKVKELRLSKGLSLQKLADEVGVTKPHIWELERGTAKNPSLKLVKKLANFFGQSVDELISDDAETSNAQISFARKIEGMNLLDIDIAALEAAAEVLNNKNSK